VGGLQGLGAVGDGADFVALGGEHLGEDAEVDEGVVDDEDVAAGGGLGRAGSRGASEGVGGEAQEGVVVEARG
jgi:hypothetical protein